MDTRIYVMTHKQYQEPTEPMYISLQVGREGKEDLGYLCDNIGENISAKNPNYCELTGLYWIWKNIKCDIAGLCHYRRFFVRDEALLSQEYVEKILQDYDIILPTSGLLPEGSVLAHYRQWHHADDLLWCGNIIRERCPEYFPSFEWSLQQNLMSGANMMIAKKEVLDEYCEWLFDILFALEERIDYSRYDNYQKRIMGFLAERLLRVWILNQPVHVREEHVVTLK